MSRSDGGASKPRRAGETPKSGWSPGMLVVGGLLVLAGLGLLGYAAWEYFGTNIVSNQLANEGSTELKEQWEVAPAPSPAGSESPAPSVIDEPQTGAATWLLRIPALGDDYEKPIVVGVGTEDLKKGVGWYPQTAQPGQIGNFALAGHRVTNGEPFRRLLELQVGAEVVVETQDAIFTYKITSAPAELTVKDTEGWVIDPVPGKTDATPTQALLTLTTCEDLFHSPDRSVAFGVLDNVQMK